LGSIALNFTGIILTSYAAFKQNRPLSYVGYGLIGLGAGLNISGFINYRNAGLIWSAKKWKDL